MEEELEAERQARAKAERQRSDLSRELEELGERLNEAGGATSAQIELNKKRESELSKLRKDLEENGIQQESVLANLKKRQQDAVSEMTEQIDQLSKMKGKIEKDKGLILNEMTDVRTASDEVIRSKAAAEKSSKALVCQLNEINKRVEASGMSLSDLDNAKRKISAENADLLRQLQEMENVVYMHVKAKDSLTASLNEQKSICDDESKERLSLLSKFRNMEHEYDGLKEHHDEELLNRTNVECMLKKALIEVDAMKKKYEVEGVQKAEELEMSKLKLQGRLSEAESTIENLNGKQIQLEKARDKLQSDLSDISAQLDQAQVFQANMEKRAKQFDR